MLPEQKHNHGDISPFYRGYRAPIVPGMLARGDTALEGDDWPTAYDCYVAAYYCNGGKGPLIKSKIEFVEELVNINAFVESGTSLVESARYTPDVLESVLEDLLSCQESLKSLVEEFPTSFRLSYLADRVGDYIARTQKYLGYR